MKLFVLLLLDTTFSRLVFFVTVTCHCSSTTKCHVNLFVYNNNNIIIIRHQHVFLSPASAAFH